jgi:hypothetical protein
MVRMDSHLYSSQLLLATEVRHKVKVRANLGEAEAMMATGS